MNCRPVLEDHRCAADTVAPAVLPAWSYAVIVHAVVLHAVVVPEFVVREALVAVGPPDLSRARSA
ncbi:hypothetical protein [Streptomyces sp. NPDC044948]|uniref:hypothetical protein n=1 Tax=Streptomyces sp. NPDC044948 TaxID=3157092 RepID=UPI0033E87014